MTIPTMHPVISSNVTEVGYDSDMGNLYVRFKTGVLYAYAGVPKQEFEKLIVAPSFGSYLSQNIKNTFPCQKIG